MKRLIIKIDEEKCIGCGSCASGCHQGALQIIDGKAKLVREDYCDGLGMCIGDCPTGALTLTEAPEGSPTIHNTPQAESAHTPVVVPAAKPVAHDILSGSKEEPLACGCPGSMARELKKTSHTETTVSQVDVESELQNFPCSASFGQSIFTLFPRS